jgi:hypothetical protein
VNPEPVRVNEDRSLLVPPGHHVNTGYAHINDVQLACRDRMAVGDVDTAYRRLLNTLPAQPWPPPVGRWDGPRFTLYDGRHTYLAALMLGVERLLVAWPAEPDPAPSTRSSTFERI